jgi:hypothetical protein
MARYFRRRKFCRFTHQVFSQRAANLPRAQNDYLHIS